VNEPPGPTHDSPVPRAVPAQACHLEGLVACHVAAFPDEPITRLGTRFVRAHYRYYMQQPAGIFLVTVDGASGRVSGVIVGGEPALRGRFLRRHFLRFVGMVLCKAMVDRKVLGRIWEGLCGLFWRVARRLHLLPASRGSQPPDEPPGTWSVAMFLCTHPDFRRRGVAQALLEGFRAESAARGFTVIRVMTESVNLPAIATYQKAGWKLLAQTSKYTYLRRGVGQLESSEHA